MKKNQHPVTWEQLGSAAWTIFVIAVFILSIYGAYSLNDSLFGHKPEVRGYQCDSGWQITGTTSQSGLFCTRQGDEGEFGDFYIAADPSLR